VIQATRWAGVRGALGAEVAACLEVLDPLPDEAFDLPTRLPAWSVKGLLGHLRSGLDRVVTGLAAPAPERADADAVTYWRTWVPAARDAGIAARGNEVAARFAEPRALVEDLRAVAREADAAAAATPDDRIVATWGPALRLDELLATRVLEMAVHGLDLADALDRKPWLTRGAATITRAILVRMLGAEPPAVQSMPDVALFELATGRRVAGRAERIALGGLARRFPLLG